MLGWLTAAWAADIVVDGDADLQAAVDGASAGDRLVVSPGTWAGIVVDVGQDVEIQAVEAGTVVLEPGFAAPALDVLGTVIVRGLVLDGVGAGLPLRVRPGGAVTVEDGALRDGTAALDGGCAVVESGTATLRRTAIRGCTAGRHGGGIHAELSDLVVEACAFTACTAEDGYGGGIAVVGGTLVARGSRFDADRASDLSGDTLDAGYGAAILGSVAELTVDGCTFTGGDAHSLSIEGGFGGGIHLYQSTATIASSSFDGNVVGAQGSALSAWESDLTIRGSRFSANRVDDLSDEPLYGGAVYCDADAACTIDRSWFEDNLAGDGGAVCAVGALTVTTSMFCANTATSGGGAIDVGDHVAGAVSIDGNVVASNTADREGGGLVVNGPMEVHNNHLVANRALLGAAVATVPGPIGSQGPVLTGNLVAGNRDDLDAVLSFAGTLATEAWNWLDDNQPASLDLPLGEGTVEGPAELRGPYDSCDPADLEPLVTSPLIDAGDPDRSDPDGSASDIGAFGGPHGDLGAFVDGDGDGWAAMVDCDDGDAAVHLEADEVCDGVDDDCDGLVDAADDAVDGVWLHPDGDGDGVGVAAGSGWVCPSEPGWSAATGDCDDGDPAVGAPSLLYPDDDGDGFGDPARAETRCPGPRWTPTGGDCDDGDPAVLSGCGLPGDSDADGVVDPADPAPLDAGGAAGDPPDAAYGWGCATGIGSRSLLSTWIAAAGLIRRRRPTGYSSQEWLAT